jgi:hypothetical protein
MSTSSRIRMWWVLPIMTGAWFTAFLVPAYSRAWLIGRYSDWRLNAALICIIAVGIFSTRELLRLRNTLYSRILLVIAAPCVIVSAYCAAVCWINGHVTMNDVRYSIHHELPEFASATWYVFVVLGPPSIYVLAKMTRDTPGS